MSRKFRCKVLFMLLTQVALPMVFHIWAETPVHKEMRPLVKAMSRTLINDNGRIKPLDTYARHTLYRFSGRYSYKHEPAIAWLCPLMFGSTVSANDAVFLINNPETANALGITPQKKRRYSLTQLMPALEKLEKEAARITAINEKERSIVDRELLRTAWNVKDFLDLSATFSFALPQPEFTVTDTSLASFLGVGNIPRQLSYYYLIAESPRLNAELKAAMQKGAKNWTGFDSAVISLSEALYRSGNSNAHEKMCMVPVQQNALIEWQSPFGAIQHPGSGFINSTMMQSLVNAARLYNNGLFDECAQSIEACNAEVRRMLQAMKVRVPVRIELSYNAINPFVKARLLYFIAFGTLLSGLLSLRRTWPKIAAVLLISGFLLHTAGLVLRMLIMHRSPVATLYETFVFVAWMSVLLGLLLGLLQKNSFGIIIASFTGLVFLYFAGKFGSDGDTMGMLAPVLNNNFWLTTHIITISMGYAGCFAAGVLAHIYLVQRGLLARSSPGDSYLAGSIYAVLAFGLTFTTIGTVLGGLWADQAWGRFWGWDPKENGALLIILCCAIVFHARAGGIIKEFGTAISAVVALNLVMLAWIGVNLLGIGLHAYGFTTAGAKILFSLVAFESVFMIAVVIINAVRKSSKTGK